MKFFCQTVRSIFSFASVLTISIITSMHRSLASAFSAFALVSFAADAPKVPSIPPEPISKKKEMLLSDDFERAELRKDKGCARHLNSSP